MALLTVKGASFATKGTMANRFQDQECKFWVAQLMKITVDIQFDKLELLKL